MCGRLGVGKSFFTFAALVGAAIKRGTRWASLRLSGRLLRDFIHLAGLQFELVIQRLRSNFAAHQVGKRIRPRVEKYAIDAGRRRGLHVDVLVTDEEAAAQADLKIMSRLMKHANR